MPAHVPGLLLLCVDLQPTFLGAIPNADALHRRCSFAIEAARALGIATAFTEQVPQKLGGVAPELLALAEAPPAVWGKATFSALSDDGIRDSLRLRDVEHVLLCGLETPICVYQTGIEALDAQLQVTILSDCVGARRADDAVTALSALVRAGVHVLPAETIFYSLLHDAKHPAFKAYTQLVKKYG